LGLLDYCYGFITFFLFLCANKSHLQENYNGIFVDCDKSADGKYYRAQHIWHTDVATKWLKKPREKRVPCSFHQNILRGCNLQSVLREALVIDPDIAFKGSVCTVGLKVESQRRLTLVSRSIFTLYKAFVSENHENQETRFQGARSVLLCSST
jgi:hypothetical protein